MHTSYPIDDDVRELFGKLVGCSSESVGIAPSTAFAMSLAAKNILSSGVLNPGKEILVIKNEMPSNVYPWQYLCERTGAKLVVVECNCNDWSQTILNAISSNIAVLALSTVHWCDGSLINLEKISAFLSSVDFPKPYFIVDGTQSTGVMHLNVTEIDKIDFLACSVHKWLCGPYGMSLMYLHPRYHNDWQPLDHHERSRLGNNLSEWDEIIDMGINGYPEAFRSGARRIDAGGRPNPVILSMLKSSISLILNTTTQAILSHITAINDTIATQLESLPIGLTLVPKAHRSGHILGVYRAPDGIINTIELKNELMKRNIYVSVRHKALRISPYLHNTINDVQRFIREVKDIYRIQDPSNLSEVLQDHVSLHVEHKITSLLKVLITGASGWLGQFLCKYILEGPLSDKLEVHVTTRNLDMTKHIIPIPEERYHLLDLEDDNSIDSCIKNVGPDILIHLAAMTSPAACVKDVIKALRVNIPLALSNAIRKHCPKCLFLFTSTDLVYDGNNPPYYPQLNPVELFATATNNNRNVYGYTKLKFEQFVLSHPHGIVLRLSNMQGPPYAYKEYGKKFLQWLFECFEKRDYIGLRCDEFRSFVSVFDVIHVICSLICIKYGLPRYSPPTDVSNYNTIELEVKSTLDIFSSNDVSDRVLNVGGPHGLSRLDVARLVANSMGSDFMVESETSKIFPTKTEISNLQDEVWKVYTTTNAEDCARTEVINPRDVTMASTKTEDILDFKFKEMSTVIPLFLSKTFK